MSFARHGALADLESPLARRHAKMAGESSQPDAVEFVTSRPGAVAHDDDDLQYMRSSFHSVRDSLLGVSRPKAAETFRAASEQRRPPPRAADRVPDYSIAYPVPRPARELSLLVEPDQVVTRQTCPCRICVCTADSLRKPITRAASMLSHAHLPGAERCGVPSRAGRPCQGPSRRAARRRRRPSHTSHMRSSLGVRRPARCRRRPSQRPSPELSRRAEGR